MILEEELIHLLPQVYQANAMAEELKKGVKFDIVLVAPQARGQKTGHTEVYVKGVQRANDHEFLWDKGNFVNRFYGMNELYQNFVEGYADWDVPMVSLLPSPPPSPIPIHLHVHLTGEGPVPRAPRLGDAHRRRPRLPTESRLHGRARRAAPHHRLEEQRARTATRSLTLPIPFPFPFPLPSPPLTSLLVQVELLPCTPQGNELKGEFVDSPDELVGKNLAFKVKINNAIGLPRKFTNVIPPPFTAFSCCLDPGFLTCSQTRVKYKFYLEDKDAVSSLTSGSNPAYNFEKKFTFKPITKQVAREWRVRTGVGRGGSGRCRWWST